MSNDSRTAARAFLTQVVDELKCLMEAGSLRFVARPTPHLRVSGFGFDGSIPGSGSFEIEYTYPQCWDPEVRDRFVWKTVTEWPSFKVAASHLAEEKKVSATQAEYWVSCLAHAASLTVVEGGVNFSVDSELDTLLSRFGDGDTRYHVIAWLRNIQVADDRYELADGLTLRRASKQDIDTDDEYEISARGRCHDLPSAILEFPHVLAQEPPRYSPNSRLCVLLDVLRLLRLGSVQCYWHIEKSLSGPCSTSFRPVGQWVHGDYKYVFDSADAAKWNRVWSRMKHGLIDLTQASETDDDSLSMSIALDRYRRALCEPGPFDTRIAYAVMALDALLGEDRASASALLQLSTSRLMGSITTGFRPLDVSKDIELGYRIRNKYVHGGRLSKYAQRHKEWPPLLERLLQYARICLLAMLDFKFTLSLGKNQILNMIGESFLGQSADTRLEECCSSLLVKEFEASSAPS